MKDKLMIIIWMLLAVLNFTGIWAEGLFFDICNYVFTGFNLLIALGMIVLLWDEKKYKEE